MPNRGPSHRKLNDARDELDQKIGETICKIKKYKNALENAQSELSKMHTLARQFMRMDCLNESDLKKNPTFQQMGQLLKKFNASNDRSVSLAFRPSALVTQLEKAILQQASINGEPNQAWKTDQTRLIQQAITAVRGSHTEEEILAALRILATRSPPVASFLSQSRK